MKRKKLAVMFSAILAVLFIFALAGCAPEPEQVDEPEEDPVLENEENHEMEDPDLPTNYFWPWLSHGQLALSSTEVVDGPHLFESDTGFIGEFTRDAEYSGRVVWLVQNTDVFEIEWITLTFDVEYFTFQERQIRLNFSFEIENLEPDSEDKGVQIFETDLVEEQESFRVQISRVVLGKQQEGSFTADPIDYVALDVEMAVVDKP